MLFIIVLIPKKRNTIARIHRIEEAINKGMNSGFSLLLRARCRELGPMNIRNKQIPMRLSPLRSTSLSVLF